jgi:hypothetical protein
VTEVGFPWTEIGDVGTLFVCSYLEGRARTRRGFFEDKRNVATNELRHFESQTPVVTQLLREVDQVGELLLGEVDLLEQAPSVKIRGHVYTPFF